VHWRALLSGRLVGTSSSRSPPSIYLPQARKEIADPTPVKEARLQDALEAVYPLKIDHFEIRDGDITYVDQGPFKPLRIRNSELVATNIPQPQGSAPIRPTSASPSRLRAGRLCRRPGQLPRGAEPDLPR